eukprot:6841224-Pyramimonas_sp.AAC.1
MCAEARWARDIPGCLVQDAEGVLVLGLLLVDLLLLLLHLPLLLLDVLLLILAVLRLLVVLLLLVAGAMPGVTSGRDVDDEARRGLEPPPLDA